MKGRVLVPGWRDFVREIKVKEVTMERLCVCSVCSTFKSKVIPRTGHEGPEGE